MSFYRLEWAGGRTPDGLAAGAVPSGVACGAATHIHMHTAAYYDMM